MTDQPKATEVLPLSEIAKLPYMQYPCAPTFLTEESVLAFEQKWNQVDEYNQKILLARRDICRDAERALRAYAIPSSRWPRQWLAAGPKGQSPTPSHLRDRMQREAAAKAKEVQRKEAEAANDALTSRAVAYLIDRGQVLGQDFTIAGALAAALETAGNECIKELVAKGGLVPFVGHNCDEIDDRECRGWDMKSRRCECGNRRVDWIVEGTFESPYVYAEAY